jgi:putative phosphonate transport system ATP-binding protein
MTAAFSLPDAPANDRARPLLVAERVTKSYGEVVGCRDVSLAIHPGEVLGIVGESGSGKTTLLKVLSARMAPNAGTVSFDAGGRGLADVYAMAEPARRALMRTEWGIVHQDPRDGLRMHVSAGGNVAERLMGTGARSYADMRAEAAAWLGRVELDVGRMDDLPRRFSGGMRPRVPLARHLVTRPRLLFMDEPTGGLDVSVQARLLDLIRELVRDLGIAAIVVTHDIAVVRLLADRLLVMHRGEAVEHGLTDQVLDDPQHPYTQLLVSSVMTA